MSLEKKPKTKPKTKPTLTMAFRLTRWYAGCFIVFLAITFIALYFTMATVLDQRLNQDLEEDVEEFTWFYEQGGVDRLWAEVTSEMQSESPKLVFFRLIDNNGHVVRSTNMRYWQELDINLSEAVLKKDMVIESQTFAAQSHPSKMVLAPLSDQLWIQIGESTEANQELLQILVIAFIGLLVIALPLASAIGWLMAKQAARGIERISASANQIRHGNLDQRVEIQCGDRELVLLAESYNAMLDRIHALVTEMREMTDNIAHDMRSPLARIRAIAESAVSAKHKQNELSENQGDGNGDVAIVQECDRLLQMINASLDVAEAGTLFKGISAVNLSQLVIDACELFETLAEEKGLRFDYQVEPNCTMLGDESKLQRMLANLIDNAIRYTQTGGHVQITLAFEPLQYLIHISDSGVGVSTSDKQKIFERFYRADNSRSGDGFGLGLSFAQEVAKAHGGYISVDSELGKGSDFIIALPYKK